MDSKRKNVSKKACKVVNKWIDMYCEGTYIKEDIKEKIDRHLSECPYCQELKKNCEQILSVLSSCKEVELPGDFQQKLHARLLSLQQEGKPTIVEKAKDIVYNLRYSIKTYRYVPVIVSLFIVGIGISRLYKLYKSNNKEYRDIYSKCVKLASSGEKNLSTTAQIEVNRIAILNFNIYANRDVEDLTLKIHLPEGLTFVDNGEVEKHGNTIVWKGGAKKGKNVIPLRVKVVKKGYWEIKIQAQKGDRIEEFRKPLNII